MYVKRRSDPAYAIRYRAERIGTINGEYFFATREGTLEGPFPSRDAAEQGAAGYVALRCAARRPNGDAAH